MEECLIALVRDDMVDDRCGYHLVSFEMKFTQGLFLKLVITESIPALSVIEVVPG